MQRLARGLSKNFQESCRDLSPLGSDSNRPRAFALRGVPYSMRDEGVRRLPCRPPLPSPLQVSAVALAGDGSVMLTGGTDCVVCLWSDSASARALGSKEACQGDGFELQARRRPR